MRQMNHLCARDALPLDCWGQDPLSIVGGGQGDIYRWRERRAIEGVKGERQIVSWR